MAIIANNIRISLSSKITQNQSFDLSALFLRGSFSSVDSFLRGDAGANIDPFLFNLPTFSNQIFTLIIEDDLTAFAGESFSIYVWHLTTNIDGSTNIEDTITIEIDASTGEISFVPGQIYFDYETDPNQYDLTVQIDFSDGSIFQEDFTVNILDAEWVNTDLPYWDQNPVSGNNTFATDPNVARIYQGGHGNDTFNSRKQADVYVPGRGNDAVFLQDDNVMQTIVYRFDSSGDEWTATDGPLTIFGFERANANGVAGDRLLLVDINPNNPYESMDSIFRSTPDGGDANKMTFETMTTRIAGVDYIMGYTITFGNPDSNNAITISFSDPISVNLFNSYRDNLNYEDADQEISHVLFGDTGFLLDPLDDLNIVVYEDVKPDIV